MDIPTVIVKGPLTVTLSESQLEEIVNMYITNTFAKHINVRVTNVKWLITHDIINERSYFEGATIELQHK